MAAVFPIITTIANPVTVITANPDLTYQKLLGILQYTSYNIRQIYFQATSFNQFSQAYVYNRVGMEGSVFLNSMFGFINPDQMQPSLFLKVADQQLILDNSTTLSFNLLPNEVLKIEMHGDTVNFNYLLHKKLTQQEYQRRQHAVQQLRAKTKQKDLIYNSALFVLALTSLYAFSKRNS